MASATLISINQVPNKVESLIYYVYKLHMYFPASPDPWHISVWTFQWVLSATWRTHTKRLTLLKDPVIPPTHSSTGCLNNDANYSSVLVLPIVLSCHKGTLPNMLQLIRHCLFVTKRPVFQIKLKTPYSLHLFRKSLVGCLIWLFYWYCKILFYWYWDSVLPLYD